jgi:hypothetical protein
MYCEISEDLTNFGSRVATDIYGLGLECDKHLPKLVQQNAWGQTCNDLYVCDAWKQQKRISAEEGIVSIGYERKYHEWSRIYQFAKLFLYAPSSGLFSCPIAMTDGAARTIEALKLFEEPIYRDAFEHLVSRDPKQFWTSGQWMTEKGGGSDVGLSRNSFLSVFSLLTFVIRNSIKRVLKVLKTFNFEKYQYFKIKK